MAKKHVFGKKGEEAACAFLVEKGYQVIETNWRLHPYEVDIIALDGETVVFTEVKTRFTDAFGHPTEFITWKKEKNLVKLADHYLEFIMPGREGRFDVVTLLMKDGRFVIEHFIGAFNAWD